MAVWAIPGAAIVAREVWLRRSAGPVLLDPGIPEERVGMGIAGRKPRLILAVLMLSFGLIETIYPRFRFQGSVFLTWGSLSVSGAVRRPFQFREAGVLGRKLFRWQDLQDYYVSPKGGLNLKLAGEWIGCVGCIPPPYRQEAAGLIVSKVPAQTRPAA